MNKAKQYLLRIRKLELQINQRIKQRDDLRATMFGARSPAYDADKVQVSHDGETMSAVERWTDLEQEIVQLIDEQIDEKHRIIAEIQALPDERHVQLLNLRYVEMLRFEEIAVTMGYSYDWVRHVHGDALELFGKMYGLNTRRHTKTH